MNRPQVDERLDRAIDVFWKEGYYDTSIEELMRRTGLHRAAVYGTFGTKRALFEAALRRYREKVVAAFVAPLERPDAGLADIERFFRTIQDAAAGPLKGRGCLMINTASEVSPHSRPVARIVSRFLDDLRALLRRACVNSRARGEARPETDVDQVADYLMGSVVGLWTLSRSPAPAAALRHYLAGVLMLVQSLRPSSRRRRSPRSRSGRAS